MYGWFYFAATGGALAAGTVFGWSSPAETKRSEYGFPISEDEWSWVGSSVTLGAAAVCLIIGSIINIIGRKSTMLLLIIPFTVGWSLVIFATDVTMLYVGRVLLGVAGGAFFVTAPMYIGEIAQKDIRGKLGTFFQLMVTVGILFVYSVGYGLSVRTYSIVCATLPIIFGAVFVFMPETPLYWVSKSNTDNAIKSLKWLRGERYNYHLELDELFADHEAQRTNQVPLMQAMSTDATKRALFIILGLMVVLQLSGINAVIFYTGFIFAASNTGIDGAIATIIVGIMQVLATFIASMVIDRLGRRILLLGSILIMGICTVFLGIYFYMFDQDKDSVMHLGWLPVVSLCVYIIVFSLGFGPIPWVLMGELFATDVKGFAGSIGGSFSWILAFVITKSFTNVREAIGLGQTFWVFSICSALGTVFVYFCVPETKGKSLNDIQRMLSSGANPTESSPVANSRGRAAVTL